MQLATGNPDNPRAKSAGLQRLHLCPQHVEAEQCDGGASPDHSRGFPGESDDGFLLTPERDYECGMIRALHQYDGRTEIEVGWLGLVCLPALIGGGRNCRGWRVLCDGHICVGDLGGGPGLWFRDAGASER